MEIPLVFRARKDGSLVYGLPLLFRAAMAALLALIAWALLMDGGAPSAAGWIAMAAVAFAALYEDRWIFDRHAGEIAHRVGLVFLARRTSIDLGEVTRFRIAPFVRGSLPGSADEAAQNEAALRGARADDSSRRRAAHQKPYLHILCEMQDGTRYFIDASTARKAAAMRAKAARIAAACGKELVEY